MDCNPFGLFDFTPVGIIVMVVGVLFMTYVGSRLLPRQNTLAGKVKNEQKFLSQYRIQEMLFRITIPEASALVGKSLASSNLGARLGLNVVGINRNRQTFLAPEVSEKIMAGDELIVEGRLDRIQEMNNWGHLLSESQAADDWDMLSGIMRVAEVQLSGSSPICWANPFRAWFSQPTIHSMSWQFNVRGRRSVKI